MILCMTGSDIFYEALDKAEGSSLEAYLDEVCGSNRELRAEVEGVLHRNSAQEGFKDVPALHVIVM